MDVPPPKLPPPKSRRLSLKRRAKDHLRYLPQKTCLLSSLRTALNCNEDELKKILAFAHRFSVEGDHVTLLSRDGADKNDDEDEDEAGAPFGSSTAGDARAVVVVVPPLASSPPVSVPPPAGAVSGVGTRSASSSSSSASPRKRPLPSSSSSASSSSTSSAVSSKKRPLPLSSPSVRSDFFVGRSLSVYWAAEKAWFSGKITRSNKRGFNVKYIDNDELFVTWDEIDGEGIKDIRLEEVVPHTLSPVLLGSFLKDRLPFDGQLTSLGSKTTNTTTNTTTTTNTNTTTNTATTNTATTTTTTTTAVLVGRVVGVYTSASGDGSGSAVSHLHVLYSDGNFRIYQNSVDVVKRVQHFPIKEHEKVKWGLAVKASLTAIGRNKPDGVDVKLFEYLPLKDETKERGGELAI